ncbi:TatD family hydrolase [Magnetococcales bacterium HHB-1]
MMIIDTHCHLDFPVFDLDRSLVLKRSQHSGIKQWIIPGVRLMDFARQIALKGEGIEHALGLHPLFMKDHPLDAVGQLETWLKRINPIAIGEIGLDYLLDAETHQSQQQLLESQLDLAKKYHLPVLLHVRRAHDQVLKRLRSIKLDQTGFVHAYSGSLQQAHQYLDLGFKLGFGGVVTFERARKIRKVAASIPDSGFVLETDAPDLSPEQHHKERNEPSYIKYVIETLALLRKTSQEDIIKNAYANTVRIIPRLKKENSGDGCSRTV